MSPNLKYAPLKGNPEMVNIKPIQPKLRLEVLTSKQIEEIKAATLHILHTVGVHFPSKRALDVFLKSWGPGGPGEAGRMSPACAGSGGDEPRAAGLYAVRKS